MGRKQPMINALARLGGVHTAELPKSMAAMGIAGGIGQLFSTHPPIEDRIAALQNSVQSTVTPTLFCAEATPSSRKASQTTTQHPKGSAPK